MLPTKKSNYALKMTQKHKHIFKEWKLTMFLFDNSWIVFSTLPHLWVCKGRAAEKPFRLVIQQNALIYGLWGFWMLSPVCCKRSGLKELLPWVTPEAAQTPVHRELWLPPLPSTASAPFAPSRVCTISSAGRASAWVMCWGDTFCTSQRAACVCLGSLSLALGKVQGEQGRSTATQHRESHSNGPAKESPVSPKHHFRSIVRARERQ